MTDKTRWIIQVVVICALLIFAFVLAAQIVVSIRDAEPVVTPTPEPTPDSWEIVVTIPDWRTGKYIADEPVQP